MSNRMPMPVPPGGVLVCAVGQMPKVKIKGGQIFAECCTPPAGLKIAHHGDYTLEFKQWALSVIKEIPYRQIPNEWITYLDEELLGRGEYRLREVNGIEVLVLFRLPEIDSDDTTRGAALGE